MNNPKQPLIIRLASKLLNPRGLDKPQKLHDAVNNKLILITGASFGIGEETAKHLAKAGAIVLLVARSADKLQA
ncbi:MAG TPA: SDR family NAD(P)-dependent oxidoreductase, partial [Agitococcus sp.]|nr:SDR family NAD(P)-dependent oxidoreductase [Agitococcus sp.]